MTARPTERPFAPTAWPARGSACAIDGYEGLLGRVEAVGPRTVRFTLCSPDGAFPSRLAHPSLGIVDAVAVDAVAGDPVAVRAVAGAGRFRVTTWSEDGNLRLARIAPPAAGGAASPSTSPAPLVSPDASPTGSVAPAAPSASTVPTSPPPPVIVLRWTASPAERSAALREAAVDGIDAPAAADAADMATLPELVVLPRPGLETAYLGFGTGKSLSQTGVRRAFAQALDRAAIARDAFPPGSAPATHTTPCVVPAGCAGTPWYEFNGPAASAALDAAKFDTKVPLVLHVPDAPVPGLPDPAATAAAVRDQLAASVGVGVEVDVMPSAELAGRRGGGNPGGPVPRRRALLAGGPVRVPRAAVRRHGHGHGRRTRQGRPRGARRCRPGDDRRCPRGGLRRRQRRDPVHGGDRAARPRRVHGRLPGGRGGRGGVAAGRRTRSARSCPGTGDSSS